MRRTRPALVGFSLLELLVAVAVIGVLIAVVTPSLSGARESSRALVCSANTRSVAQGVAAYANTYKDRMPPSYVGADTGAAAAGTLRWNIHTGDGSDVPIIHWTRMVFGDAPEMDDRGFACPSVPEGGAPRARASEETREPWQRSSPPPPDWQPARLAYTVNGALMPPGTLMNHWPRSSRLVGAGEVERPDQTVLVTEFYHDERAGWRAIAEDNERSRSNRPIMPFIGGSTGPYQVYSEPNLGSRPRFFYPTERSVLTKRQIERVGELFGVVNLITSDAISSLNAVGRQHATRGSAKGYDGGAANMAMADGHVERMHVRESLRRRAWGERFWGISGRNEVDPVQRMDP